MNDYSAIIYAGKTDEVDPKWKEQHGGRRKEKLPEWIIPPNMIPTRKEYQPELPATSPEEYPEVPDTLPRKTPEDNQERGVMEINYKFR